MKTIFITSNRGLTNRNILRTGILEKLAENKNCRVVIFVPNSRNLPPPDFFIEEFNRDNIVIEIIKPQKMSWIERRFVLFSSRLVFSKSTKNNMLYNIKKCRRVNTFAYFLSYIIYYPLSKINIFKKAVRYFDALFFLKPDYAKYFDKYQPDLVFATSIINHFDADFIKEAKRRGIKNVAMPRSWDNLDKFLFRVEPDLFFVQNKIMANETVKYQAISFDKIRVVGFPQFDMYADKATIISKSDYCQHKNFDQNLPIIFLGSEGTWSTGDKEIFRSIIVARDQGVIPNCNILIRPHFSTVAHHEYNELANGKNVCIDDKFRQSNFFPDFWDPSWEDMVDFANSLLHCHLMITFASTLALDAACFDKPILALTYGARFIGGKDKTETMYESGHYGHVLETSAVDLIGDIRQLVERIKFYLDNPEHKQKERNNLVEKLCYKLDGKSSERIANMILSMVKQ